MEQQKKRINTAQQKYEQKVAESLKGDAAIKAVSKHKESVSKAKKRASASITDMTGPEFCAANKHTAMNSDIGGEMSGVESCFRCAAPCRPYISLHHVVQVLVRGQQAKGTGPSDGRHREVWAAGPGGGAARREEKPHQ